MWGNLRGWIISAIMMAATVGIFYALAMPPAESKAGGYVPGAYRPIAIPGQDPATIVPAGTKDCNAGELYQQAIDEYQKSSKSYEELAAGNGPVPRGVELVAQAADCGQMHLFDRHLNEIINYNDHKPWIDALAALGQATSDIGLRLRDSDVSASQKYFAAAFLLGERLYQERIAWPEVAQGLSIMSTAAGGLAELAEKQGDTTRRDLLNHFKEAANHYETDELQQKVASPLGNPIESYASKYAGDIFSVARSDNADRVWRVEAILHLGRYRWNVASDKRGDQLAAPKELAKLEASSDPVIREAVRQAENLSEAQQLKTGAGS